MSTDDYFYFFSTVVQIFDFQILDLGFSDLGFSNFRLLTSNVI